MTREGGFEVEVALKLLRADVDPRGHATSRLRDEARMLGMVRHRCVPHVFDLVELDGRVALVSEYVEGADLSKCLRAAPRIPRRACLEVLAGVADALDAAYNTPVRGGGFTRIVHRDLKPANVRIARDGTPKLLDFGIAWTDAVTRVAMTQSSALVGSPAYMAPERFDAAPPTAAVDVFGLGAMLYEALTGKRLFAEVAFKELAAIALVEPRYVRALDERLAELPDDTAPELRALLAESLAFAPDARPSTEQVARRLEALAANTPGLGLVAWCRDRTWSEDAGVGGEWCGRTLVEGQPHTGEAGGETWPTPEPVLQLTPDVATAETGPLELVDPSLSAVVVAPERPTWATRPTGLLRVTMPLVLGLLAIAAWVQVTATTPPAPSEPLAISAPSAALPPTPTPPAAQSTLASVTPAPVAQPTSMPARGDKAVGVAAATVGSAARPILSPIAVLPSVDTLLGEEVTEAAAPAPVSAPPSGAPPAEPITPRLEPTPAPTAPEASTTDSARRHTVGGTVATSAHVVLDGANRASEVTLIGNGGRWHLPADLSPGRYQVQADFGLGTLQSAGSVDVSGVTVAVRCAMNNCAVVR